MVYGRRAGMTVNIHKCRPSFAAFLVTAGNASIKKNIKRIEKVNKFFFIMGTLCSIFI